MKQSKKILDLESNEKSEYVIFVFFSIHYDKF